MLVESWTFLVPARNEVERLPVLLEEVARWPTRPAVVVVDNGSSDGTAAVATAWGARVVFESRVGKGFALRAGAQAAGTDWLFLCDADITGLRSEHVLSALDMARDGDVPVARLTLGRPPEAAPVSTLVARPLLDALGLGGAAEPLGGLAAVSAAHLRSVHLPGGWGMDVALTLATRARYGCVPELPVHDVIHRTKPLAEYEPMAREVVQAVLRASGVLPWLHEDCALCAEQATHPAGGVF